MTSCKKRDSTLVVAAAREQLKCGGNDVGAGRRHRAEHALELRHHAQVGQFLRIPAVLHHQLHSKRINSVTKRNRLKEA